MGLGCAEAPGGDPEDSAAQADAAFWEGVQSLGPLPPLPRPSPRSSVHWGPCDDESPFFLSSSSAK